MPRRALYPGTFDPITNGHTDLVRRAARPVLTVWGPDTPRRSLAEIEALAALPGIGEALLPRGALGVYEEHAEEVAAATREFLAAAVGRA